MAKTLKKADGDLVLQESNGRPFYIEGIEKLSQDVGDALTTEYNAQRDWGQQFTQIFDTKRPGFLSFLTSAHIGEYAREAIERLQAKQNDRPDQLNDFEAIEEIKDVRVFRVGKTGFAFIAEVQPVAGPNVDPQTFRIRMNHQIPSMGKDGLPGTRPTLEGL